MPNPQLGPLERRIGLPYEEALFEDDVDAEAEEYWFTEPAGGWYRYSCGTATNVVQLRVWCSRVGGAASPL